MALNCPDRTDDGEPCGVCDSCGRIWGGHTALDVVEIDAASNRGVDDARDLRERAMYAPSAEGRSKVYIVDEAHMLTREAWNALLKILEEPPPRVIFVFATTEPQKIQQSAAPILSRCQRFDFRRIGVADIVAQLARVLADEGGEEAPEEALRVIARKADGGMRDALSLLDQVLSLTGGGVDLESVRRVLGLVEEERYIEVVDIVRDSRHEAVFSFVEALVDEGYDLVEFYHGLLDVFRYLLRLRLSPDAEVDVQDEVRAQLAERATAFAPGDLVRMLTAASNLESQGSLRRSPNPRLPIEMLLLRLSFLDRTVALEELISALGGSPEPTGGAGAGGDAGAAGGSRSEDVSAPLPLESTDQIEAAWARWLEGGVGIPQGLLAFLRSAMVSVGEGGRVVVNPLPGPALDRLTQRTVIDQMSDGLAPYLGRRPDILVEAAVPLVGDASRVTADEVRSDTLKALYRQEPRLERAVEELDLELMD